MLMLSGFFSFILKFFSSATIGKITDYLTARANDAVQTHGQDTTAATQIVVAQMQAEIAARQVQAQVASKHDKLVSWIGGALAFHITMIVLDSVFHLNWKVDALPAPMDSWEGLIVLTICGAAPVTNIANRVIEKVWK